MVVFAARRMQEDQMLVQHFAGREGSIVRAKVVGMYVPQIPKVTHTKPTERKAMHKPRVQSAHLQ